MVNRTGPKAVPCGIPSTTGFSLLTIFAILTYSVLLFKYVRDKSRGVFSLLSSECQISVINFIIASEKKHFVQKQIGDYKSYCIYLGN